MHHVHASTLGLSVYNALSFARCDMSREQVLAYLRQVWAEDLEAVEVDSGAEYLLERGLASESAGQLVLPRRDPGTRLAPPLKRRGDGKGLGY